MAGFGPNWQQSHILGRQQVQIPDGMRDSIMPGLKSLLATVSLSHPDHPLLPTLEAIDWLADVFLQDMPLKLLQYGKAWARLFPREVAAVLAHPQWLTFAKSVLGSDAKSKGLAVANRDFQGNPVQVVVSAWAVSFSV